MSTFASVLIIEDSPFLLARLVSLAGDYVAPESVATARSGPEALDVFDRTLPRLVVLDIGLPRLSGLQVLRHIRSRNAGTEVLVFTHSASREMESECRSLGVNHFLDKSQDVGPLIELLRGLGGPAIAAGPVI